MTATIGTPRLAVAVWLYSTAGPGFSQAAKSSSGLSVRTSSAPNSPADLAQAVSGTTLPFSLHSAATGLAGSVTRIATRPHFRAIRAPSLNMQPNANYTD